MHSDGKGNTGLIYTVGDMNGIIVAKSVKLKCVNRSSSRTGRDSAPLSWRVSSIPATPTLSLHYTSTARNHYFEVGDMGEP